jgi:hypothetical protein
LTLLLAGFALPFDVTMNAVSSYLTFSPLPFEQSREELTQGGLFSVALSIGSLESARLLVGIAPSDLPSGR